MNGCLTRSVAKAKQEMDEQRTVDKLLEYIVAVKFPQTVRIKLTKSQLLRLIKEYLDSIHAKEDPILILEEWEPKLRQQRLIGDHLVKLSPFTSEMSIEFVPSWSYLERAAELRESNIITETARRIEELTPREFEKLLSNVFSRVPWARNIRIGKISRDGGIDFEGEYIDVETGLTMVLLGQAKHWRSKVGSEPIRTFIGSMLIRAKSHRIVGVYVATGGFNDQAISTIRESPYQIFHYNLTSLAELMIKHHIGVRAMKMEGNTFEGAFWDELDER